MSRRSTRRGGSFTAAIGLVLAAAVAAYCAAWFFSGLHGRLKSEDVRYVSISECISAEGLVIRDEIALSGGSAPEGLRVGRGDSLGSCAAPDTGLYSSYCDGYEILSPAALEGLDAAGLHALLSEKPDTPAEGRIVCGKDWYFAALTDSAAFEEGDSLSADFGMGATACSVQAAGEGFLVLRMESRLAEHLSLRRTQAEITLSTRSGLRVPASAIHSTAEGDSFVWVLTAGILEKKTIEISFTGDGFCLAALSPEPDALREGDKVVISGDELYEGKIIT